MYKSIGKGKIVNKSKDSCDIEIDSRVFGPPGTKGEFVARVYLGQTANDDKARLSDKSFRDFQITASLSKTYEYNVEFKGSIDVNDGSSFWLLKKDAISSKLSSMVGDYQLYPNKNNEISKIEYKCKTTSIHIAQSLFFKGLTPLLDVISYKAGIPIIISRIICIDLKYTFTSVIYESPHFPLLIPPFTELLIEELFPIYALYREYKTNPSAYYKFLCLYKILEGIFKNLRPSLMKKAKKLGRKITCNKELIPDHFIIREYNKGFVNMKIRKLFDDVLRKEFRNAVAHFSLDDGTLLNLTDYNTNRKFSNVLFITEMCSRILINNHTKMYFQLYPEAAR